MKTFFVSQDLIDEIYSKKIVDLPYNIEGLENEQDINSYFILKTINKNSAIVKYIKNDRIKLIENLSLKESKLYPKDSAQLALIDSLLDNDIKLVTAIGPAGSGKTLLSCAWALENIIKNKEKTLILTKPTETVKGAKFFGAVPGTVDEKFAPFLDSFEIAMKKSFNDSSYLSTLKDKGKILYKPIEFIRGDTYDNSIIILDEAQNLNWAATKTLLTRVGENSKILLLGDISQKDTNDKISGIELVNMSYSFRNSNLTSSIVLSNNYRSEISRLIGEIDEDILNY